MAAEVLSIIGDSAVTVTASLTPASVIVASPAVVSPSWTCTCRVTVCMPSSVNVIV